MTDQTKIQADAAAEAPAKVAKTVAATLEVSANETAKTAKRARAATARRAKRSANKPARVTKARDRPQAQRSQGRALPQGHSAHRQRRIAQARRDRFTQRIQDMTITPQ